MTHARNLDLTAPAQDHSVRAVPASVMVAPGGPVTRALKARAASLRQSLAGRQRPDDPHVALRDALVAAHASALAVRPVFETDEPSSDRYRAALAIDNWMRAILKEIFALPAPRTPEGLAVVGLALAIEVEGRLSARCLESEDILASADRAILSATGTVLPPAFLGFADEPGFDVREAEALAGAGVLPV